MSENAPDTTKTTEDRECGENEEKDEETFEEKSNDPGDYLIAFIKGFFLGGIIFETGRFLKPIISSFFQ